MPRDNTLNANVVQRRIKMILNCAEFQMILFYEQDFRKKCLKVAVKVNLHERASFNENLAKYVYSYTIYTK